MIYLAIETSCDDTSIAIFEKEKLLSQKTKSQNIHEKFGGIVPEMASREHSNDIDNLIKLTLEEAKISMLDLNAIVVTQGPGLINALQIGMITAKTISMIYSIPLYLINHLEGHIFSPFINNLDNVPEKALILIASGGHTMLVEKEGFQYKHIASTRDDAVGESFDKVARILDIGFPGGKKIDDLYNNFVPQKQIPIKVPIPHLLDFSYSGLKSKVLTLKKENNFDNKTIAYFFMEVAIKQLSDKTIQALKQTKQNNLIVVGGVSANSLLRKSFQNINIKLFIPKLEYATDNAAMIGIAFYYKYINNQIKSASLDADSNPKLSFLKKESLI